MTVPTHQTGATCPSCGRFVGPLEKCPYCSAEIKKRIPLRYLRLACLALAIAGVAVLVFAASGAATPVTKIGNVGATMNYAYVRLQGRVTRGPLYTPATGALRFYLADDTGEIQVGAFRDVTAQLIATQKIPTVGDTVTVDGTLRVRDDFTSFNLSSADKVQITVPAANEIKIGDVGADDEMTYVILRGDVRDIRQPYQGMTLITIGDASGEIDVALSGDTEKLHGAPEPYAPGDSVQVQGVVTLFRDTPQLTLRYPGDFKKLPVDNTAASTIRIGDVDVSRVNQRVQVAGRVTRVSKFSQGMRAVIADDTGEITCVLWQDLYGQIADVSALQKGAQVRVLGKLSQYRGEFEVVPQRASDVTVRAAVALNNPTAQPGATVSSQAIPLSDATAVPTETPRPTREPTAAPIQRTIASLTQADQDANVILQGTITRASNFTQGVRYTLDDGADKIILLIWSDVLEKISIRDDLQAGAQVRVTGRIDVFNDTLQVIPAHAQAVELIAAAPTPNFETRTIGSIASADVDKVVQIQGTIADLTDFSKGKYVTLQDETGKIQITVFSNVLNPIQDRLALGAAVLARGKVNLYRGKLELVADELVIE